jgi:hypothetical protein
MLRYIKVSGSWYLWGSARTVSSTIRSATLDLRSS